MIRLRAILLSLAALLMLMGSSFAVGLHSGSKACGVYATSEMPDPASLPVPTDLMCGKRMMPSGPELKGHRAVEVPRATEAQWQFGLASDPMREGRRPLTELKPPRLG